MTGRSLFKKFGSFLSFSATVVSLLPKSIRFFLFRLFRDCTGKKGILIRYLLIKKLVKNCGSNVTIKESVIIDGFEGLEIGNNVSIHPFCYIDAMGGVTIGDNVSIAHNSSILSFDHTWDNNNIPIKYNKLVTNPVRIENDVWIGCGCRLLSGITINSRAVVAAGAVVTKDVESNTIVAGVPAKVLKKI